MKTPWHLWVIGVVTLIWNAGGAFDYVMTQTRSAVYLASFTPEQLAYFEAFPTWVNASWAIAVWGSLLGSVMLLMRSGHAVMVFTVAFLAMIATSIHNFVLSETKMSELMGTGAMVFSAVIVLVGLLLIVYSRRMRQMAVLS